MLESSQPNSSLLVYSTKIEVADAIRRSFELSSSMSEKIKEVALNIRTLIFKAFKTHSESTNWPPQPDQLNYPELIPDSLQLLIKSLICGSEHSKSDRVLRLMYSLSQDICRAVTNGQWNMPKHILLGMALKHLFRNAEVITILNRLGHVTDYCFILELESALAKALDETSHILGHNIVRNPDCKSLFHSDFDNFDQYTNQLTGAGSVHRAHGIMLQELQPELDESVGGNVPVIQDQKKTGKRSYKFQPQAPLSENFYMSVRKNPQLTIETTNIAGGEEQYDKMLHEGLIWVFLRLIANEVNDLEYPGWSGFVSLLGTVPTRLTTIDYYPVIPYPITECSTVAETLCVAEQASKEVGQKYHIVTYDLGVCMKAYPLIWNNPVKYEKHIVLIGTFHIVCAYMKMIGKKMNGSGFCDILIESGLMTSGSMQSVISGSGYARAINCHKSLMEGLERLLWRKFCEYNNENKDVKDKIEDAKTYVLLYKTLPNNSLKALISNENIRSIIGDFKIFRQEVKSGKLGPTAQLWVMYMDHVWLILSLLHAVKTNNYLEYAFCMTQLSDLFFELKVIITLDI